jgi:hypothetical protein
MTLDFYDSCILRLSISVPFSHVLSVVLPILQDFSRVDIHPLLFHNSEFPEHLQWLPILILYMN